MGLTGICLATWFHNSVHAIVIVADCALINLNLIQLTLYFLEVLLYLRFHYFSTWTFRRDCTSIQTTSSFSVNPCKHITSSSQPTSTSTMPSARSRRRILMLQPEPRGLSRTKGNFSSEDTPLRTCNVPSRRSLQKQNAQPFPSVI